MNYSGILAKCVQKVLLRKSDLWWSESFKNFSAKTKGKKKKQHELIRWNGVEFIFGQTIPFKLKSHVKVRPFRHDPEEARTSLASSGGRRLRYILHKNSLSSFLNGLFEYPNLEPFILPRFDSQVRQCWSDGDTSVPLNERFNAQTWLPILLKPYLGHCDVSVGDESPAGFLYIMHTFNTRYHSSSNIFFGVRNRKSVFIKTFKWDLVIGFPLLGF